MVVTVRIRRGWLWSTLFWIALYTALALLVSPWFLIAVVTFTVTGLYAALRPKRVRSLRRDWPI